MLWSEKWDNKGTHWVTQGLLLALIVEIEQKCDGIRSSDSESAILILCRNLFVGGVALDGFPSLQEE